MEKLLATRSLTAMVLPPASCGAGGATQPIEELGFAAEIVSARAGAGIAKSRPRS
jgi:hypothetical protein